MTKTPAIAIVIWTIGSLTARIGVIASTTVSALTDKERPALEFAEGDAVGR